MRSRAPLAMMRPHFLQAMLFEPSGFVLRRRVSNGWLKNSSSSRSANLPPYPFETSPQRSVVLLYRLPILHQHHPVVVRRPLGEERLLVLVGWVQLDHRPPGARREI